MDSITLQDTKLTSVAFLYKTHFLKKKLISFTIILKTIKYLGINLTNKVKDHYSENCKTLMKETKEDTNKWKNILGSWIGRTNVVKMSILPKNKCWYYLTAKKLIYQSLFIKIPMTLFTEVEKKNTPKIYMEPQKTLNSWRNPEKEYS